MSVTLLAVGDVGICRAKPETMLAGVRNTLRGGDIVFGQLETTVSERGARAPHAKLAMRSPPAMLGVCADAGFGVMSFAGNHCMDWGREAFADTFAHAREAGVALCGAGETLTQARTPVVVAKRGVRVAFVAVSSILPDGYWAEAERPGCAPMRAFTHYEMIEHDQPGTPPRIHTTPHPGDLKRMCEDIGAARALADVVVLSIHWGIHLVPAEIAAYQYEVARAAIDAGADLVLGHHPHILKGVSFHRGKPIFFSMGNFAIEQPQAWDPGILQHHSFKQLMALNPDFDLESAYLLPPDTRHTLIVRAELSAGGVAGLSFLPCWINDRSEPQRLEPDDPKFAAVVAYMRAITESQGLNARYVVEGDAVRVVPL